MKAKLLKSLRKKFIFLCLSEKYDPSTMIHHQGLTVRIKSLNGEIVEPRIREVFSYKVVDKSDLTSSTFNTLQEAILFAVKVKLKYSAYWSSRILYHRRRSELLMFKSKVKIVL